MLLEVKVASKHLDISCAQCGKFLVRYKKEGSGQLIRLYLDKILGPKSLVDLKSVSKKSSLPVLVCLECNHLVGHPIEHEGNRLAYRMIKGSFKKTKK